MERIQMWAECNTWLQAGGIIGVAGGWLPPKSFKKRKSENMKYFHALELLKLAFLTSLTWIYMYMLSEGSYQDFSTTL